MTHTSFASRVLLLSAFCCLTFAACTSRNETHQIVSGELILEFDSQMHSKISASFENAAVLERNFSPSEYVVVDGEVVSEFELAGIDARETTGLLGRGTRHTVSGTSRGRINKNVAATAYEDFPGLVTLTVEYRNDSTTPITISKWVNSAHAVVPTGDDATFWSYQGASYEDRRDWVLPVSAGFEQENYFGMNASDYGSGTPVSDIWRRDVGVAVGHLEIVPKLVSLPVRYPSQDEGANVSVEYEYEFNVQPGETISTVETFIYLHEGDYYAALKNYRNVMAKKGLVIPDAPDSAYEAVWCAWGYERNFSVDEVIATLPKAKELGLKWAVLDDGWQTAEGDWYLHPEKFPNGTPDMQALVGKIEDAGLKAKLWWAPLAVDPGTDLLAEHEDMLLLNEDGSPQDITWWDSYYLCPAYDKTIEYTKNLVTTFMKEWGYKGLKIDGQHLNGVPKCYNPKHNHARPEESVEALQNFWKEVYETALSIEKEAVVEICPCGTSYAFFNLPYMNQSVSSDPESSWQVRLKGKTIKALAGESAAYYGDHVELSDDHSDFASSVGIGAVVGTKFTLPGDNVDAQDDVLTPEKEQTWRKWIKLYNDNMLPKGEYLGELYDIGFDVPETHAIRKGESLYFAFYADSFSGEIELRGLGPEQYQLVNYVAGTDLGTVSGSAAILHAKFDDYLLVRAEPVEQYYSVDDFSRVKKIDAHTHLNTLDSTLIEQAIADNFELLTVNVDYPDFPRISDQYETALALSAKYPETVQFVASFSSEGWEEPGFNDNVITHLKEAREQGAIGVKVWKNIGMDLRDSEGELLMIDDSRLDSIFAFLETSGIPFLGHQGEPHNCWLPLDEMTVNNDREYFSEHPQYHMYLHPEMPSYEDQMSARDRRLEKHSNIRFVGAHLASLEWNVDEMEKFLDRFPGAYLDMAARFGQLQHQSKLDLDRVRNFIIRYQDRLLYATDATTLVGDDNREVADTFRAKWIADWLYLTTDQTITVPEIDGEFSGLKLPKMVIDKIYYSNAQAAFSLACEHDSTTRACIE